MIRILSAASLILLMPLGGAEARSRDDVMAGLYHCNGLENDRQWLDCFYGAAQPARHALGLKPALAGQIQLAQSTPAISQAQPSALRSQVVVDAGRCYDQIGDRGWLDCYYRAALPMREHLGLAVPAGQYAAAQTDSFGLRQPAGPASTKIADSITSRMIAYAFDGQSIFTVRLENGQTWRQIDGDSHIARWKKPPASYIVKIRRGMSRSFLMTVQDEPRGFRVHRIN